MKNIIVHGIVAGVLATLASDIYFVLYQTVLGTIFDSIVNTASIGGASVAGCLLMSAGELLLTKFNIRRLMGWLNVLIAVLSFASIIGPISMSLPLNIESPEMFPGLVVPMHFFPAMSYFAIAPFFQVRENLKG